MPAQQNVATRTRLKLLATALVLAVMQIVLVMALTGCDPTPPACAQGSDTYYDSATHTRKQCP
ncbi:hypothetical protein SEA_MISCHIEF19_23 [Streptomyces phage Mischief19]|nr:hypothetical protein SEA_MISCHIEF19_23 [Streptomyces phage Mischief19]